MCLYLEHNGYLFGNLLQTVLFSAFSDFVLFKLLFLFKFFANESRILVVGKSHVVLKLARRLKFDLLKCILLEYLLNV